MAERRNKASDQVGRDRTTQLRITVDHTLHVRTDLRACRILKEQQAAVTRAEAQKFARDRRCVAGADPLNR